MNLDGSDSGRLSFGEFTLDCRSRELRRNGRRIRLQPQPAKLLVLLASRGGELVTRQEIETALWDDDTFVDYEHGINFAVKQIRDALGDEAGSSRYIETIPRVGYRFIASYREGDGVRGAIQPEDDGSSSEKAVVESATVPSRRRYIGWAAGCLAGVALLVGYLDRPSPDLDSVVEMSLLPPAGTEYVGGTTRRAFALSPDGRTLAFVARDDAGNQRLGVRELSSFSTRMFEGTHPAIYPFWSPDGKHIGFFSEQKLKRVSLLGGPPQTVCDARPRGGTWNGQGIILFAPPFGPIHRVDAAGGVPEPVTELETSGGEIAHRFPHFLPDDDHFLFFVRASKEEERGVVLGSLKSRETRFLIESSSNAVYAEPGYLLFIRDGALVAQRFSVEKLELEGEAVAMAVDVELTRYSQAALTVANGVIVYNSGRELQQLTWLDREGTELGTLGDPANHLSFSLSPDGSRLAVSRRDDSLGGFNLWLFERDGSLPIRRTTGLPSQANPRWSGTGETLFFDTMSIPSTLYRVDAFGSDAPETMIDLSTGTLRDVSRDGAHVVLDDADRLRVLDASDGRLVDEVLTSNKDIFARISPDGKWLVFQSGETGRPEIYVTSFPEPGRWYPISRHGGVDPRWRGDGAEIFYITLEGSMMAAPVSAGDEFRAESPRKLFDVPGGIVNYDVGYDGEQFLLNVPIEEPRELNVLFDWTRRLPR